MNKKPFNSLNDYFVRYFLLSGNSRFPERILYYWSANYSKLLKKGEEYEDLTPVISINLLNFNLNKNDKNVHSCYMIYDTKSERLLTDHLQIHIIELKKFKFKDNDLKKDLNYWLGFFTTNNMARLCAVARLICQK